MNYSRIKYYFDKNLWTIDMVKTAVRKGIITKEQFQEITGREYK